MKLTTKFISLLFALMAMVSCSSSGGDGESSPAQDDTTLADTSESSEVFPKFMSACLGVDQSPEQTKKAIEAVLEGSCLETAKSLSLAKSLDLSGKDISDVSVFYEFTSIETINISNNKKFTAISGLIENMPNLKNLDVKNTGVSAKNAKKIQSQYSHVSIEFEKEPESESDPVTIWDEKGFDASGIHKDTGTEFGPDHLTRSGSRFGSDHKTYDGQQFFNGYDSQGNDSKGFNTVGIHKSTGTEFDQNHLTRSGSRFGSDHKTYNGKKFYQGLDFEGFDRNGFNSDGIHKRTGTEFGPNHLTRSGSRFGSDHKTHDGKKYYQGLDFEGFDRSGFNADGIHKRTRTEFGPNHLTRSGSRFGSDHRTHNGQRYVNGYNYLGYDRHGFNQSGIHRDTRTEFGPNHLTRSGSRFGANHRSYNGRRFVNGFDYAGFDYNGFNQSGVHRETETRFSPNHQTQSGSRFIGNYDFRGLHKYNHTHRSTPVEVTENPDNGIDPGNFGFYTEGELKSNLQVRLQNLMAADSAEWGVGRAGRPRLEKWDYNDGHSKYALILYPQYDHNGAFDITSDAPNTNTRALFGQLSLSHNIRFRRVNNTVAFKSEIERYSNDCGHTIDFLIIGAHGSKTSMSFGSAGTPNRSIYSQDFDEPGLVQFVSEDAYIYLDSCSTGGNEFGQSNVAEAIAVNFPGRTVTAPTITHIDQYVGLMGRAGMIGLRNGGADVGLHIKFTSDTDQIRYDSTGVTRYRYRF